MSQGASELPKPVERKSSWQSLDGKKTYHICITCMKKGKFKDLNETHHYYGKQEVYSQMLAYCYSLHASKAMCDKVIYICPKCITRLRAATDFRKQIENSQIKCKQLYYESFLCHEPKVDKPNLLCAMEVGAVVPSDIEDARMLSTRVKTEGVNLEDVSNVKTESDTKNSTKRLKLNSSEEIPTDTETSPSLLTRCPVCYESFRSGPELVRHTRIHDAAIYPGGDQESRTQEDVEMETQVLKQEDMMISCDEGDIILVVQAEDEGNEEEVNNESDFEWSEEDASNSDNEVSKPERMRYPRSGGLYACPECPYTTLSGAGIHNHYLLHQQKTFLCEECGFACRNSYKLRLHQLTHSKLKPHACHECDYTSRFASDLTFHMQKHRDDRPHTCETCGKSFKRTRHLKTHQLTHEDLGKFKCERCDFVTKSALTIARHTSNHDRMLTCKYCDQVFEKRSELTTHRVTEHDHLIKRFSCADDATLQITCDICQASFGNVKKLEKHMISHSDLRPFGCDLCDMKFKRKTDVYKHRLIHSNKKPFACSKCPFASVRAADLRVHFRKHSDLRPFPCTLCPRRFKKRDTLTRHALTHSDEKPHLCTQCGFKCRTSELLKRHLRTHVGPRLGCEECDYSCLEPRQLLKHKLKHAQEKSPEAVGGAGDDGMVIEEWVLCE